MTLNCRQSTSRQPGFKSPGTRKATIAVTTDGSFDGNDAYSSYIESELRAERDRKASLDTRGGNVVTSSGALFTILAGIGALGRTSTVPAPVEVPPLLVLTLVAFFSAAALGIAAQWNREYPVTKPEGLEDLLGKHWTDPPEVSKRRVAISHIDTLAALRDGNKRKELMLRLGYCCQAAATISLGPIVFLLVVVR